MATHRIRLFDRFRLDVSLKDHGACDLFLHFVDAPGDPHVTIFSEPNPQGQDRGRFTPHFTHRPSGFRRKLARISPTSIQQFVDEFTRESTEHFARSLSAVDVAELEAQGWSFLEAPHAALDAWLARATKGSEILANEERLVDLRDTVLDSMLDESLHCRPTQRNSPAGVLVAAVRRTGSNEVEFMQVAHFPDGFGIKGAKGDVELAHLPGWYRIGARWWPEAEQRAFYERWFGPRLAKARKVISTIERSLDYCSRR
jgi:hypothetical protein